MVCWGDAMGLNTRHDITNDKAPGYNITRSSHFKFELLGTIEARRLEVAQNLSLNQVKFAIKINGTADIQLADRVKVLGRIFKVIGIDQTYDNLELLKHREDIDNFTGDMIVGLE